MNKYLFLAFILFVAGHLSAQNILINAIIDINNDGPEGSRIVITKNDIKVDEIAINKKGRADLKFSFGADFKLYFEKPGYITKIVDVNTEVPEEVLESNPNFPPMKLTINLLPRVEGVDLSVFDQPVGIWAYNHIIDDFSFDEEYSKKIKVLVDKTEQEIRRKLASQGAAAIEQERKFAELLSKGQQSFDHQAWQQAIDTWTLALTMKPDNEEVKQKIALARKEAELAEAHRSIELQNEKAYKLLIASADSLFNRQEYLSAKEKYSAAVKLNGKDSYPGNKIREINSILAELAKKEATAQKQIAAAKAAYQKAIIAADQAYAAKEYDIAISTYEQALTLKPDENYPRERIAQAKLALNEIQKHQAEEAEKQRVEQERRNSLKNKYAELIAAADKAFKEENHGLAKLRYSEADHLNLGEEYPKKQLQEIENIFNSSKYKAKLAEYNKNKTLAEKSLQQKNYAAAKVYYEKALAILAIDKENITLKISEIDRLIEAAQLAELEKEYKAHITKADQAYREKAFAVAKFYYKKALEIKIGDQYASERLKEVEKNIGERQEKEAEL